MYAKPGSSGEGVQTSQKRVTGARQKGEMDTSDVSAYGTANWWRLLEKAAKIVIVDLLYIH